MDSLLNVKDAGIVSLIFLMEDGPPLLHDPSFVSIAKYPFNISLITNDACWGLLRLANEIASDDARRMFVFEVTKVCPLDLTQTKFVSVLSNRT